MIGVSYMKRVLFFILVPLIVFAQDFTIQMEDTIAFGAQYDDIHMEGYIYNNSVMPVIVSMVRLENNLPSAQWMSFLCLHDQCLSPFVDSTAATINQGDSIYVAIHFNSGDSIPGQASVEIKFASLGGSTEYIQTFHGSTLPNSVDEHPADLPGQFRLFANYPNPFNNQTIIPVSIPAKSDYSLRIFDITGRQIYQKSMYAEQAGLYNLYWNGLSTAGNQIASGLYFYRVTIIRNGSIINSATRKLMLLR